LQVLCIDLIGIFNIISHEHDLLKNFNIDFVINEDLINKSNDSNIIHKKQDLDIVITFLKSKSLLLVNNIKLKDTEIYCLIYFNNFNGDVEEKKRLFINIFNNIKDIIINNI